MVNERTKCVAVLLLATLVLGGIAATRSPEYDEQYTLFLTAGVARPVWPTEPFVAGDVVRLQSGYATLGSIARDLRRSDVHPPLYFWTVALWRRAFGGGLFVARLFSVLCSLGALIAVARIAHAAAIPPALAMLLTLGSYGFAYTGVIARGFALAQLLTLAGFDVLAAAIRSKGDDAPSPCHAASSPALAACGTIDHHGASTTHQSHAWSPGSAFDARRAVLCGVLLGAATAANYLAAFVAIATLLSVRLIRSPLRTFGTMAVGGAGFLALDLWFFLSQRDSRAGQFAPFHWADAVYRLARYAAANLFGGLPLYASESLRSWIAAGIATLCVALGGLVVARWRQPGSGRLPLVAAALAPPAGLLALALAFDNTPIELRYLVFAVPFVALLLAGALASLPHWPRRAVTGAVVGLQAAALVGLAIRPETMQPAQATAAAAARLAPDGLALLPHGNDGVGIVGGFAIAAPATQALLVIHANESPDRIRQRIAGATQVVVALLAQDATSTATLSVMQAALSDPCWRLAGEDVRVRAYVRRCASGEATATLEPVPALR